MTATQRGTEMKPFIALILLTLSTLASAADVTGTVTAVYDGDSLTITTAEKQRVKVRLSDIDTPERKQPYGAEARQALQALALNQIADVTVETIDRYGRTVGRVVVNGVDVNAELVRQGAAWVYRKYSHDAALLRIEQEARDAQRGLWALPESERIPPWKWRKVKRGV
jgi:endonuclease YncB( thermonuclease family)